METLKFKTNIKCNGCINAVTPYLNKTETISHWTVDLDSPDRILTIETSEPPQKIEALLKEAGYTATCIK